MSKKKPETIEDIFDELSFIDGVQAGGGHFIISPLVEMHERYFLNPNGRSDNFSQQIEKKIRERILSQDNHLLELITQMVQELHACTPNKNKKQ